MHLFKLFFSIRHLLCLLPLLWIEPSEAATLHAFIVADVKDPSIGKGIVIDRQLFHDEVVRIAYYANLDLVETFIDDADYDPIFLSATIRGLKTEPDDVVLYYHCSHGFRTSAMTERWPALFFGWDEWGLRLEQIVDVLKAKPHRLTVVIADVCNNSFDERHAPRLLPIPLGRGDQHLFQMYTKLYRESRGLIVASGAKPGQYAWIDLNMGSFFTVNLLHYFKDCARRRVFDWREVLQAAAQATLGWSKAIEGVTEQEPQFAIELH